MIKLKILVFVAILFLDNKRCVAQNLVTNPGFEENDKLWGLDNWSKNVVSYERDNKNPHIGNWSMKVELIKVINSPVVMYVFPKLKVRPGSAIQVKFWARGISNGANLTVMVRREMDPWKTYLRTETNLTDEWLEYKYTLQLPSDIDPEKTSLRFGLTQVGVFWIDDISVVELPAMDNGPMAKINTIRNPSFEAGNDGWTATFRKREFGTLYQESGNGVPAPDDAKLETKTDLAAPQGQHFLSLKVDQDVHARLTSAYFPARYGHRGQLSFSLRSDSAHTFEAGIGGGVNSSNFVNIQIKKVSAQWQTYTLPYTLKPAQDGVYFVSFHFNEPGTYDIDAVSFVENEQEDFLLYPVSLAIQALPKGPVANLFAPTDIPSFKLVVASEAPNVSKTYSIRLLDYMERKITEFKVSVSCNKDGYGETKFDLPTKTLGAFRVEAYQAKDTVVLAEQIYSVLPVLPSPETRPDSYFGGHVDFSPYNLEIAKKSGFRWLRMWPPLATLWLATEPKPGVWNFPLGAVINATKQGFQLVGIFGTAPDFNADINTGSSINNRWSHAYPPKKISEWKKYVTKTYMAYRPYIKTWEVWNEPDGGFLMVKPELKKPEVYAELFKATRQVLDSIGKPVTLLGPAVANINASLGWDILKLGTGSFMDAFSFHFYSLAAGGSNPDDAFVLPLLEKFRTYKNKAGEPMPLWHTEGGVYLQGGRSWLATSRIPSSSPMKKQQAAASMVRAALFFKAMGVKRYFDYELSANAAGREVNGDATTGFIEVTGIPGPGIAAHAAMVAITEDAAPAGFEHYTFHSAEVKVAHFTNKNGNVDVYWSDMQLPIKDVANLKPKDKILDLMGNPLSVKESKVGEFPLYVVRSESK